MNYYEKDGKKYDVSKLSEETQAAFYLLAKAETEIREKSREITIFQAGVITLHQKIQEELTDEALVPEED